VEQYQGVSFKIFCGNTDLDGSLNEGVVFDRWTYYNAHTQVWYSSSGWRSVGNIRKLIGEAGADILFVIGIYSWYFNLLPLLVGKVPVKIVSARGMLHPGALSQKSFKKNFFIGLWKLTGLYRRHFFHATDEQERIFIQQNFGKRVRVFIAGNFPRVFDLQPAIDKKAGALSLVSIALISPMKNIGLVLEALRTCREQIRYTIYGPIKDALYWEQCLELIRKLPANVQVDYRGEVIPAEIVAALKGSDVFILPSKSENFGHAIFEALSAGKPVITSFNTPFNGLYKCQAGLNVSLDDVGKITAAIGFFAGMDQVTFNNWNVGANKYAMERLDLEELRREYDLMFGQNG